MANNGPKHEFALHVADLSARAATLKIYTRLVLDDKELCRRITGILRLQEGDSLVLFDRQFQATVVVQEITKRTITVKIIEAKSNRQLNPPIIFALPLLKKDDFETALYSLVELGATTIQPVLTHKVQRSWGGGKESERIERIMISAAEQSKNFNYPVCLEPISFDTFVQQSVNNNSSLIFFDPDGIPLVQLMPTLSARKLTTLILLVGPEGDLSAKEKDLLRKQDAIFCQLTPTVLRSCQAIAVGLGAVRSLIDG